MSKARAKYRYRLEQVGSRKLILIQQAGAGLSLTNDIENVVADIMEMESIDENAIAQYLVLYEDTEGRWDGWDHVRQEFILLGPYSWKAAEMVYIAREANGDNIHPGRMKV